MKTDRKILIAFCLNLFFSIFEFIGGIITGSVAIMSDSIHDFGDSLSIGISLALEKLSKKKPNDRYTFGYYRYSVLGGIVQSVILAVGSALVLISAVERLLSPEKINYDGMIIIAVVGFAVNFIAAYFTSDKNSINEKAINLHMLEDVLGWAFVLLGAFIMKLTNWSFIDPLLSILLAVFIIVNAMKNLKSVLDIFLEKTPDGISLSEIKSNILSIDGIFDVHHLHIWSMDGFKNAATMHIITDCDTAEIKQKIKYKLEEYGVVHSTIECERTGESCNAKDCISISEPNAHHHHNHHHHH